MFRPKCVFLLWVYVCRSVCSAWRTDPTSTLETQRYAVNWKAAVCFFNTFDVIWCKNMILLSDFGHVADVLLYSVPICLYLPLSLSQLASNVSSFAVCNDFLIITTHSHTCRCLQLSTLTVKGMDTHTHTHAHTHTDTHTHTHTYMHIKNPRVRG